MASSNKRIFDISEGLVQNFHKFLRTSRICKIQTGFGGGDIELSDVKVAGDSNGGDNYALSIELGRSTESGERKLTQKYLHDNLERNIMTQKEGTTGAAADDQSGGINSGSRSASESATSSSSQSWDETNGGDNIDTSSKPVACIRIIERSVDGKLIVWGFLPPVFYEGYLTLARWIRLFSPYDPDDSYVHILWPCAQHTPVFLGVDDRVLDPRERWEDFAPKLSEIYMLPMETTGPAIFSLPRIPIQLPDLPQMDIGNFYWLSFQGPSTRIFVIRRSAIRYYHTFFWIINGLWASWRNKEPQDAGDITEANVVQKGHSFVLRVSDRIELFDHKRKKLELPRFLTTRKQIQDGLQLMKKIFSPDTGKSERNNQDEDSDSEDENSFEDDYPKDNIYEGTWDFLSQVLAVVITPVTPNYT